MTQRGGILSAMRAGWFWLALVALVFKAAIPSGFMLEQAGDRVAIVLCGGEEAQLDLATGQVSHGTDPAPDHQSDQAKQRCPFALASAPALPQQIAQPVPSLRVAFEAAAYVSADAPVFSATGPPLPARGPPTHA